MPNWKDWQGHLSQDGCDDGWNSVTVACSDLDEFDLIRCIKQLPSNTVQIITRRDQIKNQHLDVPMSRPCTFRPPDPVTPQLTEQAKDDLWNFECAIRKAKGRRAVPELCNQREVWLLTMCCPNRLKHSQNHKLPHRIRPRQAAMQRALLHLFTNIRKHREPAAKMVFEFVQKT